VVGRVADYLTSCEVREDEVLLKEAGTPLTVGDGQGARCECQVASQLHGRNDEAACCCEMSMLADILDRLSGIGAVRERVSDLTNQLADMRKVIVEQQKDIAGLQGQLRALIQMQSSRSTK